MSAERPRRGRAELISQSTVAAAAIEGVIVTAATMTVVSEERWNEPILTALHVLATVVVLWLGHAFAHGLAERASAGSRSNGIAHDVRSTWPMVVSAMPQLAPMLLVGRFGLTFDTALYLSYAIALASIAAWGWRLSQRRAHSALRTVGAVGAVTAIGLALILLKLFVH